MRARPHQGRAVAGRLLGAGIAAKRQIGDDRHLWPRRFLGPPPYRRRVAQQILHRHGEKIVVAQDHVSERVTDEETIYPGITTQRSRRSVVERDHGQELATRLGLAHGPYGRYGRHGLKFTVVEASRGGSNARRGDVVLGTFESLHADVSTGSRNPRYTSCPIACTGVVHTDPGLGKTLAE